MKKIYLYVAFALASIRSDSEEILQGSENGCVLILKKVYGVALVGTGGIFMLYNTLLGTFFLTKE